MEYDLIVSLGGSCAVAYQLQCRDLRRTTSPFDWLFSVSPSVLGALADCIRTDFSNWMKRENLILLEKSEMRAGASDVQYSDSATGYRFVHDFSKSREKEFDDVSEKYKRRIRGLCNSLKVAKTICLCYDSEVPGAEKEILKVKDAILEKYGHDKRIDCFVWEFKSTRYEIGDENGVMVFRYPHQRHTFMYHHLSFEFEVMNDWRYSDLLKADKRGKGSWLYVVRSAKTFRIWLFRNCRHGFELTARFGKKRYELLFGERKTV